MSVSVRKRLSPSPSATRKNLAAVDDGDDNDDDWQHVAHSNAKKIDWQNLRASPHSSKRLKQTIENSRMPHLCGLVIFSACDFVQRQEFKLTSRKTRKKQMKNARMRAASIEAPCPTLQTQNGTEESTTTIMTATTKASKTTTPMATATTAVATATLAKSAQSNQRPKKSVRTHRRRRRHFSLLVA